MRILILGGGGSIAAECARDLLQTAPSVSQLGLADSKIEKARQVAVDLHDDRVRAVMVDVSDVNKLTQSMEGYDFVINLSPASYSLVAMRSAIAAKRNYVDLGSDKHVSKQMVMDAQAKDAGITVCLGAGVSPGISNLLVAYAADQMSSLKHVRIATAKFNPLTASDGELDRVLAQFDSESRGYYYSKGSLQSVEAFQDHCEVEFAPPIGVQQVYTVANAEPHTLPQSIDGVESVEVRAAWRPEVFELMRALRTVGLLSRDVLEVKGVRVVPKELVRTQLSKLNTREDSNYRGYHLHVECEGDQGDFKIIRRYRTSHPSADHWGRQGVARMVGIPISIAAQLISGSPEPKRGVLPPEVCLDPQAFLRELGRRGVHCTETVLAENTLC